MAKINMSQVVANYTGIADLKTEATKRRVEVARAVVDGRITHEAMAQLLGITESAVHNIVKVHQHML